MDLGAWVQWWGGPGLLAAAWLAATLVPISSEAAVVLALELGMAPWEALLWASVGNCLGVWTDFALGWLAAPWTRRRLEQGRWGRAALDYGQRWGVWSLLGAWLPLIGDPICLAAGLLRVPALAVAALACGTRVARYVALVWWWG